jgi:vacuolar protein sorting-associated protein VTA1
LSVWQTPLEAEVAAKSKYAKFHALRIAKALKAGEDPNLSNPVQDQPASPTGLALSPNDPEVQHLNALQPTVEDASDHSRPPSFVDTRPSVPPASRSPTVQPFPQAPSQPDVSPLESSPNEGYFPNVPTFTADNQPPSLPTASEDVLMGDPPIASPQDFYNTQPSPQQPPLPPRAPSHPQMPAARPAPSPQFPAAPLPHAQPVFHQPQQFQQPSQPEQQVIPGHYNRDDESVMAAQKHAKWAISALNFEDVDTAVSELRIALRALGAT